MPTARLGEPPKHRENVPPARKLESQCLRTGYFNKFLVLQHYSGFRDVGIYTAASSLLIAGSAFLSAVGVAVTPRLARLSSPGQYSQFWSLVLRLLLLAGASGIIAVAVTSVLGEQIMATLFGSAFAEGGRSLSLLMIGMTCTFLASVCDFSLVARRRFRSQLQIHSASTMVCCVAAFLLIPDKKVVGAAWSLVFAAITRLIISATILNAERINSRMAAQQDTDTA